MLYAMGITQHTYGGENVKLFAQIQTLMGNKGRCGGGINALRGIHNVQGSTDMGLLYGNIPGYSGNPTEQYPAPSPNAFGRTWTRCGAPRFRHGQQGQHERVVRRRVHRRPRCRCSSAGSGT